MDQSSTARASDGVPVRNEQPENVAAMSMHDETTQPEPDDVTPTTDGAVPDPDVTTTATGPTRNRRRGAVTAAAAALGLAMLVTGGVVATHGLNPGTPAAAAAAPAAAAPTAGNDAAPAVPTNGNDAPAAAAAPGADAATPGNDAAGGGANPIAPTATAVPPPPGAAPLPDAPFHVADTALPPLPPIPNQALPPVAPVPTLTAAPAIPAAGIVNTGNGRDQKPSGPGCGDVPQSGRVVIGSLCINAPVVPTVVAGDGSLIIPVDVHKVGLWTGGAAIVAPAGTTVIAGHVDDVNQGPGAMNQLHNVAPGAVVSVTETSGQVTRWQVTDVAVVGKDSLPPVVFAGKNGPRRLALVTCGGPLLHLPNGHGGTYGTYRDNIVVTAVPA